MTHDYYITYAGGNCPVQIEGKIQLSKEVEAQFYFRARGSRWTVKIWNDTYRWEYEEKYGTDVFDAGWMTLYEAHGFLAKSFDIRGGV